MSPGMREAVQEGMMRAGICHYMIAFREAQDERSPLTVFDFGPVGADISLPTLGARLAELVPGAPLILPHLASLRTGKGDSSSAGISDGDAAGLLPEGSPVSVLPPPSRAEERGSGSPAGPSMGCFSAGVQGGGVGSVLEGLPVPEEGSEGGVLGEVRETSWKDLPEGGVHMAHLGTTTMSLEELRDYMQNYDTTYSVHKNDCRHFVDQCAAAAMGMSGRASKRAPSQRMQEAGVPGWHQNMFAVAANLVDYNNWAWVKTGCQLTLASVVLTRSPLTPLKYALAPLKVAAIHGGKHLLRGRVGPAVLTGVATVTAGASSISEAPLMRQALSCASRCFSSGARMARTASSIAGAPLRACTNFCSSAGRPVMRVFSGAAGVQAVAGGPPVDGAAATGLARIPCPAATACPMASATRHGVAPTMAKRAPIPAVASRGGAIMADEAYVLV